MDFYFQGLLSQYHKSSVIKYQIARVLENRGDFLPAGFIPADQHSKRLNILMYDEVIAAAMQSKQHAVRLLYQELHGGIGTGVQRDTYLRHRQLGPVTAKGMDLAFEVLARGERHYLSILEIRLLRLLQEADRYSEIALQYIINPDNQLALDRILDKPNFDLLSQGLPEKSYRRYLAEHDRLSLGSFLYQDLNPTVEYTSGNLSQEHKAPGGHGELATSSLYQLATKPESHAVKTIRVYCKGNSVNESPDESIVRWMSSNCIPIVMTARLRTPTDTYGGIFGLERLSNGAEVLQLFERDQAEESGQIDMFLDHSYPQYYDTNTILVNDSVLAPFLSELRLLIGDETYRRIITAELHQNCKEVNGKRYIQLEGILASPFLKLNRFIMGSSSPRILDLRNKYGFDKLIYLINVDTRWPASTSIKTAFNFWLFAHTDHFYLDTKKWTLVNRRPGHAVMLGRELLGSVYYNDLHDLIGALKDVSVVDLDYLDIKGKVKLSGAKFAGSVHIANDSGRVFDLNMPSSRNALLIGADRRIHLENVFVSINKSGQVKVQRLPKPEQKIRL